MVPSRLNSNEGGEAYSEVVAVALVVRRRLVEGISDPLSTAELTTPVMGPSLTVRFPARRALLVEESSPGLLCLLEIRAAEISLNEIPYH